MKYKQPHAACGTSAALFGLYLRGMFTIRDRDRTFLPVD